MSTIFFLEDEIEIGELGIIYIIRKLLNNN